MKNSAIKLAMLAIVLLGFYTVRLYAKAPKKPELQVWPPGCAASVPRSWGVFRGGSAQSGLAFEDSAGTLRFVTNIPCDGTPTVALEIHRTADKDTHSN